MGLGFLIVHFASSRNLVGEFNFRLLSILIIILFERSLENGNIRGTGNGRRQRIPGFGSLVEHCKLLNVGSARVRPIIRSMPGIKTGSGRGSA